MKYRSILNYDFKKEVGEINNLPTMTVPGEALTPRQLLENFVKGAPLPKERRGVFEGGDFDEDDQTRRPDFDLADYTEIEREIARTAIERYKREKAEKDSKKPAETRKPEQEPTDDGKPPATERSGGAEGEPANGGDK